VKEEQNKKAQRNNQEFVRLMTVHRLRKMKMKVPDHLKVPIEGADQWK